MTTRHRSLISRARRLNEVDQPVLLTIVGNPEARKRGDLYSDREALIRDDHFVALDGEETDAFHARLRQVAKERGVRVIELGHESNRAKPRSAPPYLTTMTRPPGAPLN